MKKRLALATMLITILCQTAFCWVTGNDLVKYWKEYKRETGSFLTGMYTGYIAGCLDGAHYTNFVMSETNYDSGNIGYEIPETATLGQICSVIGKWLDNNPEKWNYSASILVLMALREAFPKAQ